MLTWLNNLLTKKLPEAGNNAALKLDSACNKLKDYASDRVDKAYSLYSSTKIKFYDFIKTKLSGLEENIALKGVVSAGYNKLKDGVSNKIYEIYNISVKLSNSKKSKNSHDSFPNNDELNKSLVDIIKIISLHSKIRQSIEFEINIADLKDKLSTFNSKLQSIKRYYDTDNSQQQFDILIKLADNNNKILSHKYFITDESLDFCQYFKFIGLKSSILPQQKYLYLTEEVEKLFLTAAYIKVKSSYSKPKKNEGINHDEIKELSSIDTKLLKDTFDANSEYITKECSEEGGTLNLAEIGRTMRKITVKNKAGSSTSITNEIPALEKELGFKLGCKTAGLDRLRIKDFECLIIKAKEKFIELQQEFSLKTNSEIHALARDYCLDENHTEEAICKDGILIAALEELITN